MKKVPTEFTIEIGDAKDMFWIAECQVAMAKETENFELNYETVVNGVRFMFDNPDRGFYVIARQSSLEPAGILLVLKEWSDWRNGDVWWLHSVYVIPKYRRQNIFSRMFQFVEKIAQEKNVKGIRLYVDKTNLKAQQVYEKLQMTKEHYEMYEKMF
ncbi:hypothetical protein B6I21_06780 [candidate division KSB1 bacterium 4572_119]|nr:MAG: hypothetical protein B6I21_06780 [candidate division KSB1 bacterium 4572_119]